MAGSVFWTPLVKTNDKDSKHTEEKAFPLFRSTVLPKSQSGCGMKRFQLLQLPNRDYNEHFCTFINQRKCTGELSTAGILEEHEKYNLQNPQLGEATPFHNMKLVKKTLVSEKGVQQRPDEIRPRKHPS